MRSLLSRTRPTSAMLRAGRSPPPEKITSSMPDARMFFDELSPMTQRRASTRLDLPQPFGPTMPVRPGSIRKSVGSTEGLEAQKAQALEFHCLKTATNCRGKQENRRDMLWVGSTEGRSRDGGASHFATESRFSLHRRIAAEKIGMRPGLGRRVQRLSSSFETPARSRVYPRSAFEAQVGQARLGCRLLRMRKPRHASREPPLALTSS